MSELATTGGSVPALYNPQTEIDASDISLPRVKIGQFMSAAVQDDLVKAGVIYSSLGQDDLDPEVLWDPKAKGDNPGLLFHILDLRKGWSASVDGDLKTFRDDDPERPDDAWRTYDYIVCLPEHDPELPFKLMFTRTGMAAAKKINFVLKKNAAKGPSYQSAFRLSTAARENDKGKFFVPLVSTVDGEAKNVQAAEGLIGLVAATPRTDAQTSGDAPAI